MAKKTLHRKHFLISAGVALAGIVGLRRLGSKSTVDASESTVATATGIDRIKPDPRAVPRSVETV